MTREEAIRWLTQDYCCNRAVCELHSQNLCQTENCEIWMAIKALEEPERKHGRWIPLNENAPMFSPSYCSECGEICRDIQDQFCYRCGARMDGEGE